MTRTRILGALTVVVSAAAISVGAASAASPPSAADAEYTNPGTITGGVKGGTSGSGVSGTTSGSTKGAAAAAPVQASGGLPFTGFSLVGAVVIALALLVSGIALRRFASRSTSP